MVARVLSPMIKPVFLNGVLIKYNGLGLALSREILSITGITIGETGEMGNGALFEMTVLGKALGLASSHKE
ncbi:MAG: hypothetical protein WCF90_10040 [Methanomicrobiales archaeon]